MTTPRCDGWSMLVYSPEFQRRSRLRELSPYWRWLTGKVPRAEIEAHLLASDRSERGVFEAFLRVYADRRGKAIIGEKTPAHLAYAETLLEWFPDGRVVHCMRDPRAIYVSELRRRTERPESVPYRWLVRWPAALAAFVLLQVTWSWAAAVHRHRRLSRRYPRRYRMLRFEDLVTEPRPDAGAACVRFSASTFEPRMLEQKVTSRGARVGEVGFDAGAADRWRDHITVRARRTIGWLLGRRLEEMDYRE